MIRFSKIIERDPRMNLKKKATEGKVSLRETEFFTNDEGEGKSAVYRKLFALAKQIESWVKNNADNLTMNISHITSVLSSINNKNLIYNLYSYLALEGDKGSKIRASLVTHSIDTTIFSLIVGIEMGYNSDKLLALAMVAFLHDVGMYKIPDNILGKRKKLSASELAILQTHPEISADILSKLANKYTWLADISLQVHERADGSGYPRGLKDDKIHEYAYIIGLADMYSAMIKDRPYRDRIEMNKAMRVIIASSKGKFPNKIVKAFLNQISFYPIGCYVRLNDRSVSRVISTNKNFPLKPVVKLLYDTLGKKLKETKLIDLSKQPLLYITESIDEKDIV